jgi:NAD(P)-dependent dehydrogenase (short-subunit alcohol dehydrogenase family)
MKKVIIVTGGSSGLGLATAHLLHQQGNQVIITGRDPEKLKVATDIIGPGCEAVTLDMNNESTFADFVEDIVKKYGRIDSLVNNAGINSKKPFLDVTDSDFDSIMKVNTSAVFSLTREVVRHMVKNGIAGSVVNVSSMAAQYGIPYVISYTASKTAIDGMTRALAVELGPKGIRVNAVAPGFIKTPMSARALDNDPDRKNKVLSRTPLGILGEPIDIAHAVAFLISDEAKFINGVILKVDGGNSIGF